LEEEFEDTKWGSQGNCSDSVVCFVFPSITSSSLINILYLSYRTKETEDHKDYQKELIEVADFSALEWKLHGLCVRPEIQKLLKSLC
jgi:hypothetical protein